MKIIKHWRLVLLVVVAALLLTGSILLALHWNASPKGDASAECRQLVQRIEGAQYHKILTLNCTYEPRTIGNSTTGAHFFDYGGETADSKRGACFDPGMTPDIKVYCPSGAGIVTADGKIYFGLGYKEDITPLDYDYCYSGRRNHDGDKAKPTVSDLYFYGDKLYNRDVFKNVTVKTSFGNCLLNGTTLADADRETITNVTVDYQGFPAECQQASTGKKVKDYTECVYLVTSAKQTLDVCYPMSTLINKDGIITGWHDEHLLYKGQLVEGDCEGVYVQRMAALDKCPQINDAKMRASCQPKIAAPGDRIRRIRETI
jgi:hypothetical protein